jgi:hypothetical protein
MTDANKSPSKLISTSIDDSIPTAIIYCIQDLSRYNVEIRHNGTSRFIERHNQPAVFLSKAEAKKAALANKAVKGYFALSLTYQEVGELGKNPMYEYMTTDLYESN